MTIKYYSKEVYGKTMFYFADAEQALCWRILTNRKTITGSEMGHLAELTGVTFERVFGPEEA